jgi:hypothetical protein
VKKVFFYLFILAAYIINSHANERSDEIFRIVMGHDGYIDEKLYNEYWKQFKSKPSQTELDKAKPAVTIGLKNQRIIWNAIFKSVKQHAVVKTLDLEDTIKLMKAIGQQKAIDNTYTLLSSAANGTPADIRGEKKYITEDLCQDILAGIDAGFERINILLSRKWNPIVRERKLGSEVSVLSAMPFTEAKINVAGIMQTQYKMKIDYENEQAIAVMKNHRKDTTASTDDCIKGIGNTLGLEAKLINKNNFRGKQSSSSSFILKDKNTSIFIEATCVNSRGYLISILSFSTSLLECESNQVALLNNIQLNK